MLSLISEQRAEATFTGRKSIPGGVNTKNDTTWNYVFGRTHNTGVKKLMAETLWYCLSLHNSQGWISCEEHSGSVWKENQLTTASIYGSPSSPCCRAHCPFVGHWNGILDSRALSSGPPERCTHLPRKHGPEKRGVKGMGIRESHQNRGTVQNDAHD